MYGLTPLTFFQGDGDDEFLVSLMGALDRDDKLQVKPIQGGFNPNKVPKLHNLEEFGCIPHNTDELAGHHVLQGHRPCERNFRQVAYCERILCKNRTRVSILLNVL